eukprot:15661351-Heterocapsa_arctica.AAC.1
MRKRAWRAWKKNAEKSPTRMPRGPTHEPSEGQTKEPGGPVNSAEVVAPPMCVREGTLTSRRRET